ncbi:MAG: lipopolysaccharide biosynthesis protein [Polyangiaceae bacterium]
MIEGRVGRVLARGAVWVTLGEVLAGAVSVGANVVSARVLSPGEFGLMGTVMLTIGVLESLTTSGFTQALVQRDSEVESLLNVAWTWHVLRGALIAALMAAAAPYLASFYREPRLMPLVLVCTSYVLLHGFHNVGTVYFDRKLDFRTQFLIKIIPAAFSALVFVPAVLLLRNVWALVIGTVGGAAAHVAISYVSQPFRPRLEWNRKKLGYLLGFGRWITGATVMVFIITQGDNIFVSKYLGLTALGFYQLAYNIANLPATNITHVVSRVSFPTYARLQHDKPELRTAFLRVVRTTLLIAAPVSVVIWGFIPLFCQWVIGPQWSRIVPLVRILVLAGFVRSFAAIAGPVFQALGRPDLDFKMNLPRFLCTVGLIWPACARFGLEGVCWVVLIAISTTLPTWLYGIKKLLGLGPLAVAREASFGLFASLPVAAIVWWLER